LLVSWPLRLPNLVTMEVTMEVTVEVTMEEVTADTEAVATTARDQPRLSLRPMLPQ